MRTYSTARKDITAPLPRFQIEIETFFHPERPREGACRLVARWVQVCSYSVEVMKTYQNGIKAIGKLPRGNRSGSGMIFVYFVSSGVDTKVRVRSRCSARDSVVASIPSSPGPFPSHDD